MAYKKMQPQASTSSDLGMNADSVFRRSRIPSPIRRFDDSDFAPVINPVDLGTGGVYPEDQRTGVINGVERGIQPVDQGVVHPVDCGVVDNIHRTEGLIITQPEEERLKTPAVPVKQHEGALLPRSVPSHLLMISLLEHLCMAYTNYDAVSGKQLFQMISEHLIKMKVVSPLTVLDEMSSMRSQYRYFMHNVLEAAMLKISSQRTFRALPAPISIPRMMSRLNSRYSLMTDDEERMMATPRYKTEFKEMDKLGRGGFGSVYKAKHNLDGKLYAIKKIKFKHSKPDVWMKILREVKALANLQHSNIVGYNAAWMEYQTLQSENGLIEVGDSEETQQSGFSGTESDDGIQFKTQSSVSHKQLFDKDTEDYNYQCRGCTDVKVSSKVSVDYQRRSTHTTIHKAESFSMSSQETFSHVTETSELWGYGINRNMMWNRRLDTKRSISCEPVITGEKSVLVGSEEDIEYSEDLINTKLFACLFIQMELCSINLKEWMINRNERCKTRAEFECCEIGNLKIFRQILKGLDFIHSKGLIHRDIKPTNIFLREPELHVKIGDFGLAKDDLISSSQEDVLLSPTPDVETSTAKFRWDDHTSGVGTSLYAAPEQLNSHAYNNKCDVYSLGVMLYEIFHKFDTDMERHKCLTNLRDSCIMDEEYIQSWPKQSEIVAQMTHKLPHNRPTTKGLLVSELFLTKDQMIKQLQTEVEDKDSEIKRLKNLLQKQAEEKDSEIRKLRDLVKKQDNALKKEVTRPFPPLDLFK